jgi:putative ABC transport system permease protein
MRWYNNVVAAIQVVAAHPARSILLAVPVATSIALGLTTLAIERGVAAKAHEAAVNRGTDLIVVYGGGRIVPGKGGMTSTLTELDVAALQSQLRGAGAILPTHRENEVPVSHGAKNGVYKVFGVTPPWFEVRDFPAEHGQIFDYAEADAAARVAVIGKTVARELFGNQDPLGQEVVINQVPFQVKGVLVSRGASPAEGDRDARIVIPIKTFATRLYNQRIHLGQIVIQVPYATAERLTEVAEDTRRIMRKQHRLGEGQPDDFVVRTPESIAEESRVISRGVFYLLLGLASLLALVAALAIVLIYQHAIQSRRGEIGIRRAVGAEPRDILQQVWAEGVIVGLGGAVLGMAVGLVAAWGLARWRDLPLAWSLAVFLVPVVVVLVTALAAMVPARAAAGLDPAEALRPAA